MPVVQGRDSFPRVGDHDVVVGSTAGGSYIIDVFKPRSSEEQDWKRHPDFHELQAMTLRSGATIDWVRHLRERFDGVMDFAVARERGPEKGATWPEPVESVVRVFTSQRGDARIWRYRGDTRETALYRYEVLDERDPLDLAGSLREYLVMEGGRSVAEIRSELERAIASEEGLSAERWTALLSHTLRADSIYQLSHLYDSDRAGTINVFPAKGVGMNSGVAGRHAGEAFGEKNGTVFFLGAGLEAAVVQTARAGSVPVTLYHWLVGDAVFRAPDPDPRSGGVPPVEQFGYRSLLGDAAFEGVSGRE